MNRSFALREMLANMLATSSDNGGGPSCIRGGGSGCISPDAPIGGGSIDLNPVSI